MTTKIKVFEKPKLKNPIFIEGLPGIGSVGRIAAWYLIEELKAKKFAELTSSHFLPVVILHDNEADIMKNEFYYWKDPKKKRDIVILVGDTQPSEPTSSGHFEVSQAIVDFVASLGVKSVFTLGGFPTGQIEEAKDVEVLGAVNNKSLVAKYKSSGANFTDTSSRIGMIIGATGLIIGLAKEKGIDGCALLGETTGFPIITDPRAAEKIIKVLIKMLGIKVDLAKIDKSVREMEDFIKKMEKIQQDAMKQLSSKEGEKLSYIG